MGSGPTLVDVLLTVFASYVNACIKRTGRIKTQSRTNEMSASVSEGVTSIGGYTFYNCVGLTSVMISEGATSIEDDSFKGCTRTTSMTIPDSVEYVGHGAFDMMAFYSEDGTNALEGTVVNLSGHSFKGSYDKMTRAALRLPTSSTEGELSFISEPSTHQPNPVSLSSAEKYPSPMQDRISTAGS